MPFLTGLPRTVAFPWTFASVVEVETAGPPCPHPVPQAIAMMAGSD